MRSLFAVQSRHAPDEVALLVSEGEWLELAWFTYYDQAHLFIAAMQKRFPAWEHRIVELDHTATPGSEPA